MSRRPLRLILIATIATLAPGAVVAQKGVDTQTKTIESQSNKVTSRPTDVGRSFDWGEGKTKVRERLPNPYKLAGRRDAIVNSIIDALRDKKVVVDEASSRPQDGIIVTLPFVFAKGAVVTQNGLSRYGILDSPETAWVRGQYTLTIEVQPVDGAHNNVSVNAKIEGRTGSMMPEWVTLRSSGLVEDEFLAKLIELVTGQSVDPVNTDH